VQPLPPLRASDFADPALSFVNLQLTQIAKNVNALTPSNPKVNVPAVQMPQLKGEYLKEPGLPMFNQFLTSIITRLNSL